MTEYIYNNNNNNEPVPPSGCVQARVALAAISKNEDFASSLARRELHARITGITMKFEPDSAKPGPQHWERILNLLDHDHSIVRLFIWDGYLMLAETSSGSMLEAAMTALVEFADRLPWEGGEFSRLDLVRDLTEMMRQHTERERRAYTATHLVSVLFGSGLCSQLRRHAFESVRMSLLLRISIDKWQLASAAECHSRHCTCFQ